MAILDIYDNFIGIIEEPVEFIDFNQINSNNSHMSLVNCLNEYYLDIDLDLLPPKSHIFESISTDYFFSLFQEFQELQEFQEFQEIQEIKECQCSCGCGLPFNCITTEIRKQKKNKTITNRKKGPIIPKDYYICSNCNLAHYNGRKCLSRKKI
jgi:hypothetical protein